MICYTAVDDFIQDPFKNLRDGDVLKMQRHSVCVIGTSMPSPASQGLHGVAVAAASDLPVWFLFPVLAKPTLLTRRA